MNIYVYYIIYYIYILHNKTGEVDVNGRRVRRLETANKREQQTHYWKGILCMYVI